MWKPQPPTALSACPDLCRDFFTFTTGIISVHPNTFSIIIFQCILTEPEHSKYALLDKNQVNIFDGPDV